MSCVTLTDHEFNLLARFVDACVLGRAAEAVESIVDTRVSAALGEVEARLTALRSGGNSIGAAWMLIDSLTIVREARGEVGG